MLGACVSLLPIHPKKGTCLLDCPLSLPTSTSVPGNTSSEDTRPALNFNGMANAILVEPTGFLMFNNVRIADFAPVQAYTYTPSQPYINRGTGYGLWPTIALALGALVRAWARQCGWGPTGACMKAGLRLGQALHWLRLQLPPYFLRGAHVSPGCLTLPAAPSVSSTERVLQLSLSLITVVLSAALLRYTWTT